MLELNCETCNEKLVVAKRCSRCKQSFYCSRQCQIKDWEHGHHRQHCWQAIRDRKEGDIQQGESLSTGSRNQIDEDGRQLVGEDSNSAEGHHATYLAKTGEKFEENERSGKEEFESDFTHIVNITVMSNKKKHKLSVKRNWSSVQIWNHIADKIRVPAEELKMIHKGRKVDKDVIERWIVERAVFQAIGVEALSEEGLDSNNVHYIMSKMKTDRNTAISALRLKGDAIDAILYLGNR